MTFQEWIDRLIAQRYGTATALAEAIGIRLTPLKRGAAVGTYNVVNLLKLAKTTDTPPSDVLRMAGKEDEALLIESLYGTSGEVLSPRQREVIDLWERIPEKLRVPVLEMMRYMAAPVSVPSKGTPEPPPSPRGTRAATRRGARRNPKGRAAERSTDE